MGGGTKIKNIAAQYAPATPEQTKLLQNQMDWFSNLKPVINNLTDFGSQALANVPQFNYGQMYNDNMPQQQQIQSGFNGLVQGRLPDGFEDNQRAYIERSMNNSLGSTMAKWADKGLIDSSMARRSFGDVSGWASEQLQKNQLQNMSAVGNALGQSQQALWAPMQYAQGAQEAAMNVPTQAFGLAGQLNQPVANTLAGLLNQQTALSSPAQTMAIQKSSPWGAIGNIAGSIGAAAITCFPAGTLIKTPRGAVPIEEIQKNDVVFGADLEDQVVLKTYEAEKEEIIVITTDEGELRTTEGQRLMLKGGDLRKAEDVEPGDRLVFNTDYAKVQSIEIVAEPTTVYELDVTGENLFWADGFLVEGMVE